MPTANDSGGVRRKLGGLAAWVTHAGIWLGALLVLPHAVYYLLNPWTVMPFGWYQLAVPLLFVMGLVLVAFHENGAMCERCFAEVPADAAVRATREGGWDRWMLHYYHKNWKVVLPLVLLAPAVVMLIKLYAVSIVWDVVDILLLISWRTHRLLRPWCPWCNRWDDGGSHECIPEPDPSMEKQR